MRDFPKRMSPRHFFQAPKWIKLLEVLKQYPPPNPNSGSKRGRNDANGDDDRDEDVASTRVKLEDSETVWYWAAPPSQTHCHRT